MTGINWGERAANHKKHTEVLPEGSYTGILVNAEPGNFAPKPGFDTGMAYISVTYKIDAGPHMGSRVSTKHMLGHEYQEDEKRERTDMMFIVAMGVYGFPREFFETTTCDLSDLSKMLIEKAPRVTFTTGVKEFRGKDYAEVKGLPKRAPNTSGPGMTGMVPPAPGSVPPAPPAPKVEEKPTPPAPAPTATPPPSVPTAF